MRLDWHQMNFNAAEGWELTSIKLAEDLKFTEHTHSKIRGESLNKAFFFFFTSDVVNKVS